MKLSEKVGNAESKTLKITAMIMAYAVVSTSIFFSYKSNAQTQTQVSAQEQALSIKKKQIQKRKPGLTSKITHKRLEKAMNYARYEKYNKSIAVLIDLLKQTKNRKDEFALVWQQLGFVYAQNEQMDLAAKALENSLKVESLPMPQTLVSLYNLGQLYLSQEQFDKAKEKMQEWFAFVDQPHAEGYVIMANILAQTDEKELALKYINEAINSSDRPDEKWLQLALALNFEQENYQNALKILATLTSLYPQKDRYWKQFSGVYLNLNQDYKALATMELAYKLGHLNEEADLMAMANLQLFLGMPYKAASVLERELKVGRVATHEKSMDLLSQCLYGAKNREQSLEVLKVAAKLSSDGKLYNRLGLLYLEQENYDKAITAFSDALQKGGVEKQDDIYFAMAVATYSQKNLDGAMDLLAKARDINEDNPKVSRWIDQLKNEKMNRSIAANTL